MHPEDKPPTAPPLEGDEPGSTGPRVFVDADACPVKEEVYRVAGRHRLPVVVVANSWMRVPAESWIRLEVVKDGFDAADDWIVEQGTQHDLVITADVPLADRCVKLGLYALSPSGREFTEANMGDVLATRDLLTDLRMGGERTGGPPPFSNKDRSQFLQSLDKLAHKARRKTKT